jgi:isoleucyl-tRNA synthetase
MLSNANPWDNLKFSLEGVAEVQRRFFGTLTNTYAFFALYANLDHFKFDADKQIAIKDRPELDQWILSKLQSLILEVEAAMDNYDATRATRAIMNFTTDQLSNWYVRLARKRFWRGDMTADKQAAYETLYECLQKLASLMASFAPFYAEWMHQNLAAGEQVGSLHLSNWPAANREWINEDLEQSMQLAQEVSSLVHSLRKKEKVKVRQPLQRILIPVLSSKTKDQLEHVEGLIKAEVNIKEIEYIDDTSGILVKSVKPNFPKLGKQFGPKMKSVAAVINGWGKAEISEIEKNGTIAISLDGENVNLELEDVIISSQDIPGWSVASEAGLTVALDVNISDELKQEGIARDLVNRIQNMRKDMGLEVQDKIKIQLEAGNELVDKSVQNFSDYICTETQALSLNVENEVAGGTVLEMDEFEIKLSIKVK